MSPMILPQPAPETPGVALLGIALSLLLAGAAVPAATDSSAARFPSLTGDWDNNHGVVYLDQDGDRITAQYDYKGKRDNRLEGVLKGDSLEVTLFQPSFPPPLDRGRAVLKLKANGTRWEGP